MAELASPQEQYSLHMAPLDRANLLAGQAVAYATSFLDGRQDAAQLSANARSVHIALMMLPVDDASLNFILVPVRLLNTAMSNTAAFALHGSARGPLREARLDRWRAVVASLVELVLDESRGLIPRHCEEHSDEPIQHRTSGEGLDCFASLAMTGEEGGKSQ